ncbi:DUF2059 domain-containing protein [Devosia nitrariae]|uniref:DUF2059 domain-containing protein n=1 Tax=Devosia nitrariae TaxID=2071872 RepID=A0ABQ5W4Z6_9HYPH|nr:DUF2059 domain-containing protein [Devosia nitrariae]GLQ55145.1 hypothetical protein GCM10010862_24040 [Devosia nitrariae]
MTGLVERMRKILAVLLAAGMVATAAPVMAQELAPEHLALAREYVDLTDRAQIYEVTLVETGIETLRQVVTQNPEIIDQTDAAITAVLDEYRGRKGELLDQFARVYAVRFTMDELQEIVDFYSTPTGEKLAQTNAEINGDLERVLAVFESNLKREFFAKVRAELREQGIEI